MFRCVTIRRTRCFTSQGRKPIRRPGVPETRPQASRAVRDGSAILLATPDLPSPWKCRCQKRASTTGWQTPEPSADCSRPPAIAPGRADWAGVPQPRPFPADSGTAGVISAPESSIQFPRVQHPNRPWRPRDRHQRRSAQLWRNSALFLLSAANSSRTAGAAVRSIGSTSKVPSSAAAFVSLDRCLEASGHCPVAVAAPATDQS